jgi:ABC-type nitrate/sulfonate/bicarbonate transport system permease component
MKPSRLAVNALGILVVLLLWEFAGLRLGDALVATPIQVAQALVAALRDAALWPALWFMIWQMMLGYLAALIVGIPLGTAMGRSAFVLALVKPWASMFVVISAAAIVPLFIILMGRGVLFLTSIVFAATVWYVVLTMTEASRAVSPRLIDVARAFDANPLQRFHYVILPALHPYVLIAARIGLVHALRAMVTAEMFISAGFGGLINDAGLDLSTAPLFALIVILMLISISATALLRWIAHYSAPWYASRAGG